MKEIKRLVQYFVSILMDPREDEYLLERTYVIKMRILDAIEREVSA